MKSGEVFSKQVDYPVGSPDSPLSFDRIAEKFRHCCEYSVKPISKENQDALIRLVKDLEDVEDVSRIIRLLG